MMLIIASILILVWLIYIVIHKIKQSKNQNPIQNTTPRNVLIFITFLVIVIGSLTIFTINIAKDKGLYSDEVSITALFDNAFDAMYDQSDRLSENPKSTIVFLYRFDCETCTELDPELDAWANTLSLQHLFVSSRSEQGAKLVAKYSIDEIPCALIFDKKGIAKTFYVYDPATDSLNKKTLDEASKYVASLKG